MAILLLGTSIGVGIGIMGDFLVGNIPISFGDIIISIVLSPFTVTFGGKAVTTTGLSSAFLIGGLLFWPIYALLARLWLRKGKLWILIVIVVWCSQGFFQVVHRLHMILSA